MMFCPKCGSLMMPGTRENERVLQCSCGYVQEGEGGSLKESGESKKEVEVASEDQEDDTLPTTEADCPQCGHDTCYYWLVQTRASDEPETKFLKCCNCKHTFRDYD